VSQTTDFSHGPGLALSVSRLFHDHCSKLVCGRQRPLETSESTQH